MPQHDPYPPIGIDLRVLEDLFKGDRSRVCEWLRLYLEEAPKLFAQIRSADEQGDVAGLSRAAHELRPQAHYLGAPRMLALLKDIGEQCRKGDPVPCHASVRELLHLGDLVESEIRSVLTVLGT